MVVCVFDPSAAATLAEILLEAGRGTVLVVAPRAQMANDAFEELAYWATCRSSSQGEALPVIRRRGERCSVHYGTSRAVFMALTNGSVLNARGTRPDVVIVLDYEHIDKAALDVVTAGLRRR